MSVTRNLTPSPLGAPRREDGVTPAGRVVDLAFPVRRDVDAARPAARDATGRRGLVFFRHPRPRPRSRRHAGRGQVRRRDEHTQVPPPAAACMCAAWVPARPHSSPRCGVGAPLPSRGALARGAGLTACGVPRRASHRALQEHPDREGGRGLGALAAAEQDADDG